MSWDTQQWGEGILSGSAIKLAIEQGYILIDPFEEKHLNPSSVDVRLGSEICVYQANVCWKEGWRKPSQEDLQNEDGVNLTCSESVDSRFPIALDMQKDDPVHRINRKLGERFLIRPGIGYLMHTLECVGSDEFVFLLDGKSSVGRKFISVHQTAGFCDPGFRGEVTLEVSCLTPTWLVIGQRIGQVRFHTISGIKDQYKGRYTGANAKGAVPSRSWEQIEEQGLNAGIIQHVNKVESAGEGTSQDNRPSDPYDSNYPGRTGSSS
jgi:dCTP deaminase